jgi:excinuclease ABC subunit C
MCRANAAERIAQQVGMTGRESAALEDIRALLGLTVTPTYIECYDISNTAGSDNVAGMVVFENGKPLKSAYRRFRIKSVIGQDDYASMTEVLTRRLDEYLAHKDEGVGFGRKPDLILLDGGEGHVSTVKPVIDKYGLSIPVFGLVKDDHHRTRALVDPQGREFGISATPAVFSLIGRIQEETHRFAIEFHRSLRSKGMKKSSLEGIPGVGPAREKALLKRFGTVNGIARASVADIARAAGVNAETAAAVQRVAAGAAGERLAR